jgi:molybdate transport system ATP-binding protein
MGKSNNLIENTDRLLTQLKPWLDIQGVRGEGFGIDSLSIYPGELWCFWGELRSGIERLVQLLSKELDDFTYTSLVIPDDLAVVSFSSQQKLFEREVRNDDSDYLDKIDPGTLARDFLGEESNPEELIRIFRLEHVLESGYRQLSSGESRKLILLEAITKGAHRLLIQNPYDGLDIDSCADFDRIIARLVGKGLEIIIVLTSIHDIPYWCTHIAYLKNGSLAGKGIRKKVLARISKKPSGESWLDDATLSFKTSTELSEPESLVSLRNGRARYGERVIFSGLNLEIEKDNHTLITGPNGAGKSTLLAIISGDHPDCYTNDLHLFGIRRGSGESIWDLKKKMGIVSPDLHRNHYIPGNATQIVISGFFDSIGLYRNYTSIQEQQARAWLSRLGLQDLEKVPFRRLSFGEQRLVLIARALIKTPELLLLDEPTQGLDDNHRENLLKFLEHVAELKLSTIVYVSHRRDEYRDFFRQHLTIDDHKTIND